MNNKTKFKVGQKVKLLPSIVNRGVLRSEIGKVGIITSISPYGIVNVKTDFKAINRSRWPGWSLQTNDIAPVIKKGIQLLFAFMSE